MRNYLLLKHGGGYLLGVITRPDDVLDPTGATTWDLNNLCIVAALSTRSCTEDQDFLLPFTDTHAAWMALKSRHEQVGPIAQILLIQQAFALRYRRSERFALTSTQLSDLARRIYAIGIPKEEDFLTILMLNAMGDDLPHVRNHVANAIVISTPSAPYGPTNIRSRLELEQQLVDNDKGKTGDVAMIASNKSKQPNRGGRPPCPDCGQNTHTNCCTTCGGWWHSTKDCYGKGGAMEGKKDKIIAKCRGARAGGGGGNTAKPPSAATSRPTKGASTGKPGGLRYDTNGRAYLLDAETHEAIFVASTPTSSTSGALTPTQEFAGLAYNSPTSAFIQELPDDAYDALFAAIDLQVSVDWRTHSQPVDFAGITYKAPNQRACTPVDPSVVPFFLDSGASVHISNVESDFYTLRPIPPRVVSGIGNSSIQAIGVGTIRLIVAKGIHLTLDHVLFIPNATVRLLSVSAMCAAHRCIVSFDGTSCWVQARSGTRMLTGSLTSRKLYAISGGQLSADHAYIAHREPTLETWHKRLGHANYRSVYNLARSGFATGMPIDLSSLPPVCDSCILRKQTKTSIPKVREGKRADRRLGIVHVDLMEHPDTVSATGNRYIMDIIDDFSSYSWSIPLASKSDAFPALEAWTQAREVETGLKVGILRSDNGELKSSSVREWLLTRGTSHQFTAPYTSAHNGRIEHLHRTLMGKARAMRTLCDIPANRWDEFVLTATYLTNRTPVTSQLGYTPYERWFSHKPDLSHLHEIGCRAFVLIQNRHNPKIFNRSTECILIGYSLDSKAYRCYHRAMHKVFVSHHVSFIESFNDHHTPLHPGSMLSNPPATSRPDAPSPNHQRATATDITDSNEDDLLPRHSTRVPVPSERQCALDGTTYVPAAQRAALASLAAAE
jgi:hypothetical protein